MVASIKQIRKFNSLFSDPNMGLAILEKNKICQIKLFKKFWLVKSLDLYNSDIHSLAGIENFQNLKQLSAEENKVEDLSPLSHLRKLKELNLYKIILSRLMN